MMTSFDANKVDMRVDEEIWGHRIYNEQTPWLCFLEFLGVLYAIHTDPYQQIFVETEPNTLRYTPHYRLYLRNILFNNPRLAAVMKETDSEEGRWQRWFQYMQDTEAGLAENANFYYLQKRFEHFSDFVKIVDFLRGTAIEGDSNKRWSSKFVFPYGPDCFYEDVAVSATRGSVTNDRRFFARTGEILYLMICRSGKGQELFPYLQDILFKESKWNKIVRALQPDAHLNLETKPTKPREGAYLPPGARREYGDLATDWLNILKCAMPGYDSLPHLVTIMGLHILLYLLHCANEMLLIEKSVTFVLEIICPEKNSVHQLATTSFRENNGLTSQAVEAYIDQKIATSAWQDAIKANDIEKIMSLFREDFGWDEADSQEDAKLLIKDFKERALSRHQKHLERVHSTWGGAIGLSSKRHSRSIRYTPQDTLLKTLVLCTVSSRMEFQEFLDQLYCKYGFIIGPKQALLYFDAQKAEQDDFKMNEKRLEDRLASLGLLKRLSDAYAYVENPFA